MKEHNGVNANFLSAMHRTTGDFIAIADQDDIWEADKIANQMTTIGNKLLCSGLTRPFPLMVPSHTSITDHVT